MRCLKSSDCVGRHNDALVNQSVPEVPATPVDHETRLSAAHGKGSTP